MTEALHTHTTPDGTLIVTFDAAGRGVNTITHDVLEELEAVVERIDAGRGELTGVIFTSGKEGFVAGADLFEVARMDRAAAERFIERGQAVFERIAQLRVPTVAAINGHCLGGGLELALACRSRVAVDDGAIRIGVPETKTGLIPAWGGTTRLTEMLGPFDAMKLIIPGTTLSPQRALRYGFIDELVRREALHVAARRLARHAPPRMRPPVALRAAMRVPVVRNAMFKRARERAQERTGGHYPAADAVIDVIQRVAEQGHDAGLEAERTAMLELYDSDTTRNLMRLFFLRHEAKRTARTAAPDPPATVRRAAVVGGGTMGAGIAHALVTAGVPVRLIEVDASAAAAALRRIKRMIDDDRRDARLTAVQARQAMERISPTTDWKGLRLVDVVIEAAAEKPAVKRDIFQRLGELTRPETLLATNTSALDITEMARAAGRPTHVVGLHFFNPVPKMNLVEIVRLPETAGAPLATGVRLAERIGKTAIVVNHAPGFLVNRLVLPQLVEALHAVREGVSPRDIDRAMRRWGMPMGPCELIDHVGLDIAMDILDAIQPRLGERFAPPEGLSQAVEHDWRGRKSGKGFYVYPGRWGRRIGREPQVNEGMLRSLRPRGTSRAPEELGIDEPQLQERLTLPMVNEAARVLLEGVTDSTDTIDLATVLGLGLAPFRGGLVHWAETAMGLREVVRRLDELAQRYGSRFEPADDLRRIAEQDQPMLALARQASPLSAPRDAA